MSKTVRKLKDQMNMLQRWEVMRRFGRRFTLAADSFRPVFENIYLGKKGLAVATTTHTLLAIKDCHRMSEGFYSPKFFDQVEVEKPFPDWEKVVPESEFVALLTADEVAKFAKTLRVMDKMRTGWGANEFFSPLYYVSISYEKGAAKESSNYLCLKYGKYENNVLEVLLESKILIHFEVEPQGYDALMNPTYLKTVFEAIEMTKQPAVLVLTHSLNTLMLRTEKVICLATPARK